MSNKIYFCGGYYEVSATVSNTCLRYESGKWSNVANMTVERQGFTMNTVGARILVTGGYTDQRITTNTMELFDSTSSTWTLLDFNLTSARDDHCAVTVSETEVVTIGGWSLSPVPVEKYDITKKIIETNLTSFPDEVFSISAHACTLYNGEIIVSGGTSDNVDGFKKVYALNLNTLEWSSLEDMNYGRWDHTMQVVNGQLMVFGGNGGANQTVSKTLEIFDGIGWSVGQMASSHDDHASVVVNCT